MDRIQLCLKVTALMKLMTEDKNIHEAVSALAHWVSVTVQAQ